jgi:hypothetical protein
MTTANILWIWIKLNPWVHYGGLIYAYGDNNYISEKLLCKVKTMLLTYWKGVVQGCCSQKQNKRGKKNWQAHQGNPSSSLTCPPFLE